MSMSTSGVNVNAPLGQFCMQCRPSHDDARGFGGDDVRDAVADHAGVVDLDRVRRADRDADAAAAARSRNACSASEPGGRRMTGSDGARRWSARHVAAVERIELAERALDRLDRVGERLEQLAQALAKEPAAIEGTVVGHGV